MEIMLLAFTIVWFSFTMMFVVVSCLFMLITMWLNRHVRGGEPDA